MYPSSTFRRFDALCEKWLEAARKEADRPVRLFRSNSGQEVEQTLRRCSGGRSSHRALSWDRPVVNDSTGACQTKQIEESYVYEFEETHQLYELFALARRTDPSTDGSRWLTLLGKGGFLIRAAADIEDDPMASSQSIGYALCQQDLTEISICELCVDPLFRRKGDASTLLAHLKARCLNQRQSI